MKHTPQQVIIDRKELEELESELEALKKPASGEELSEAEQQEATGILLVRALQNPNLFRTMVDELNLGKYKAIFLRREVNDVDPILRVKFVRT